MACFRTVVYDCTLYRDKERFLKMLIKLREKYDCVRVNIVEPKTLKYQIVAF